MDRRHFLATAFATGTLTASVMGKQESVSQRAALQIGLVADPQYADFDPKGTRFYRQTVSKLTEAVQTWNRTELDVCINLGDLIDRDWRSYSAMERVLATCTHPLLHVLGNHDFDLENEHKPNVPGRLQMPGKYYSREIGGWRLIVLDSNDISTYAYATRDPSHAEAESELERYQKAKLSNAQTWNGAVGDKQLEWLRRECKQASQKEQRVILFAHHPIAPKNAHNLWNAEALLPEVLSQRCVAAWINGHNHAGNYDLIEGVPFITLHGMVETVDRNAFSILRVHSDRFVIEGHGREPSREILFRAI